MESPSWLIFREKVIISRSTVWFWFGVVELRIYLESSTKFVVELWTLVVSLAGLHLAVVMV